MIDRKLSNRFVKYTLIYERRENLRIESSVTGMESERSFSAVNYSARSYKISKIGGNAYQAPGMGGGSGFLNTLLGKYGEEEAEEKKADKTENAAGTEEEKRPIAFDIMKDMTTGIRTDIVRKSETPQSIEDAYARHMSLLYIFSVLFEEFRDRIHEMMSGVRSDYESHAGDQIKNPDAYMSTNLYRVDYVRQDYYEENESMSFAARGKARCADGREIEYDINVGMSRRFADYAEKNLGLSFNTCIDPLVINLNSSVASLSDQHFYFDLDADGSEELISSPASGSGFIALDKNGDGKVNDGSELFGTSSGNGFKELSEYDEDGDGWIDEDDDIFHKLRVWVRDEDGKDKLISFKDAGVGAINLTHADADFSLKDDFNKTEAIVRSTGMFLYEDGRAGTVQQIDMVS